MKGSLVFDVDADGNGQEGAQRRYWEAEVGDEEDQRPSLHQKTELKQHLFSSASELPSHPILVTVPQPSLAFRTVLVTQC